ncbi:MAG: pilus assembly PilX N-terminal domain-containing protein [Deltaproteobacteria bacterium]|jgi:hypothetical protein|nr:MAG: pilus assembly PilX N-terminal domain-containing protein [Deltaproteobacteria bacterium]
MITTLKDTLNNENGLVIVFALLMLAIVTVIGIAATRTSETELRFAGKEKLHKLSFYAAEAARGYVPENPSLYGGDNITVGGSIYFPNNADPSERYTLDSTQSFKGDVEYLGFSAPPRGSGYGAGKFKAHRYMSTGYGYGPSNDQSQIEAGFYRIGF